jgi:oligopeptide transport system permease protein
MNTSSVSEFSASDFLPLEKSQQEIESVRSSLSFWQNVGQRLLKDPRAWFSFIIIGLIILLVLIGPLLWKQSPAAQWLGQISSASSSSQVLPLSYNRTINRENYAVTEFSLIKLASQEDINPSTEAVYLVWPEINDAIAYRIYRHERAPKNHNDIGLPLAELPATQFFYTDSLSLRSRHYWYSLIVVTQSDNGVLEISEPQTISVFPQPVMDFMQAQLQGLIPFDAEQKQWIGKTIEVPGHPLGTDALGRDLLARLLEGGKTSLFIGLVAPLIFVSFGAFFGATAALLGGQFDNWMMRFADFIVALPFLLFMILIRITAGIKSGESGTVPILIALVLLSWPTAARLVRAQVLQLKHEPYIQSAILGGASTFYLVRRHLLPNVLGVVLVTLSFAIPQAIFIEAFLSFIGMGVTPPTASWGSLCQEGLKSLLIYPRELLWPAGCIAITVLAFNILGDALRDALDLRMDNSP